MEVVDWQDALKATLDPAGLVERLAFRTMAIPARIVGRRLEAAVGADVEMAAERGRPTRDDGACNVVLAFCQGVELAIVALVAAKDVRHLERRSHYLHARWASGVCWHQTRSSTRGLSMTSRGPVLPSRTWISMRLLSMSSVCNAVLSPTRRPAP